MSGHRHRIGVLIMAFTLATVFAGMAIVPAFAGTIQSGYQVLKNVDSAKCMDDPGASQSWGVQMQQWQCGSPLPANQTWNFFYPNTGLGTWMIQNKASGLCLDVWQANYTNGAKVVQWPCDGSDNAEQFWPEYSGTPCSWAPNSVFYKIRPMGKSSMVVELNGQGSANGMKIDIWQYWGGYNQIWYNC